VPRSGESAKAGQRALRRRRARALLAAVLLLAAAGLRGPHGERSLALDAVSSAAASPSAQPGIEDPAHGSIAVFDDADSAVSMTTATAAGRGAEDGPLASLGSSGGQDSVATVNAEPGLETGARERIDRQSIPDTPEARLAQLLEITSAEGLDAGADVSREEPITVEPAVAAEAAYEDQYLLEDSAPFSDSSIASFAEQPFGEQRLEAEMLYYKGQDDLFGDEVERGGRVFWSHETENWGTFDLDVLAADVDSDFGTRQTDGSDVVATLRQRAVPISATALLDAAAGHQRTRMSSLLHSGYRLRLPSSVMLGVSGEVSSADRRWRIATGDIGNYRGVRIPTFDESGGRLTTIGYEQRINDRLELGGEMVDVSDDDDIRDHTSLLLAGRYTSTDGTQQHAAHMLADDDGNIAVWSDSRFEAGSWVTLRSGVFHFDRDVVWADLPIARGQTGAYVRADTVRSTRFNISAGYDYLKTDLGTELASASDAHSIFFTGSLRLRRALSLGINTHVTTRAFTGLSDDDQISKRLTAFALVRTVLGDARLEAFTDVLDSDLASNDRDRHGVGATFNWRMPERVRLTTELRSENVDDLRGATRQSELSALFRYDLFDNLTLGLNSSLYRTAGSVFSEEGGLSFSADARWAFLPDWSAALSLSRNRADYRVDDPSLFPPSGVAAQSSIWLTVRYERRSGQPYPRFGRTHDGMSGSGRISGQVFFDLNGDAIRQPSEGLAAGVVVVLDGRYETRTDDQGRYSFGPVPTGEHELSIVTEELPLPWGLDDETPRRIVVRFRQESALNFGLTEMQ